MPASPWAEAGAQIAGNAVNGILGIALGGWADKRQQKQQRALDQIAFEQHQRMTTYNMSKQLEMWEKTGYGATKEQMKKAGINPGLLYGMGGAGGATTAADTGGPSGQGAPVGGGEIPPRIVTGKHR